MAEPIHKVWKKSKFLADLQSFTAEHKQNRNFCMKSALNWSVCMYAYIYTLYKCLHGKYRHDNSKLFS